mmetsp:Transcript_50334/g.133106  ORF Transcript_50334/g.133106 Transcript_50334/m.133106 type:complete len:252 (-) Transcript_50334:134-889(-)
MALASKVFCEKSESTSIQVRVTIPLAAFSLQSVSSFVMMRFSCAPLMTRGSGGVVYRNHSRASSERFSNCPRVVGSLVKWLWWKYKVWSSLHLPSSAGISVSWLSPRLRLRRLSISPTACGSALSWFWLRERDLRFGRRQTSSGISLSLFWSARRSSRDFMKEISGRSSSKAFLRRSRTLMCGKARKTSAGMAAILLSFRSSNCRFCCAAALSRALRLSVPNFTPVRPDNRRVPDRCSCSFSSWPLLGAAP